MNNITDVFFDLDHTLWDFDKNSALTFDKIFKLNNIEVKLQDFLNHYEGINQNYWKLFREEKIDKDTLRFGRLNDAFLAIGEKVSKEVIVKLSDDYMTYLSTFNHLFDDTIEILNYLQPKYKLHIITNGFEEVQHKKLIRSNIHKFFKTVTNSETAGVKKPNPIIFNVAIEQAKVKVKNSIMIGDNYEADILGAQNIGMDVIFLDVKNVVKTNGVKKINNLKQIKEFL